jgi:hypothetical protein
MLSSAVGCYEAYVLMKDPGINLILATGQLVRHVNVPTLAVGDVCAWAWAGSLTKWLTTEGSGWLASFRHCLCGTRVGD